jgi:putative transposase
VLNIVKVRLYPNKEQKTILNKTFGSVRFVYNQMLEKKIKAYEKDKTSLSCFSLIKELPIMKKTNFDWLKEIDSTALQQSIKNMEKAYQGFFKLKRGYPKFKSRHHSKQSYQITIAKLKEDKLYLAKIGLIEMRGFRKFGGELKTVTISKEANQYHASLLFDDGKEFKKPKHNGKKVGIDVGVALFATLSNGKMIKPLKLDRVIKKMKKSQKSLSRKKKGSNNRTKAKEKLQKAHLKIANKRKDFLHKLSNEITSENQTIVIEKLKIKNMTKSATGTVEEPKKSSGKRGLNRAITQQSWGLFFEMLKYKAEKKGGEVIEVDPKFTSQKCSSCGHISKENRKSQSKFRCIKCDFKLNADLNASLNILNTVGHMEKAS